MKNIFVRLTSFLFPWREKKNIENAVDKVVSYHADSLKKLDLYDRGEIHKTKDMVKHPAVRDYLRKIQAASS